MSAKWQPWFPLSLNLLTPEQLEKHGHILSAVATDALVQKHQAISIQIVNIIKSSLYWTCFKPKYSFVWRKIR